MISTMFGGDAFSRSVAAAPKRNGKMARPPSPNVNASGGEPTNTSSGVTAEHFAGVPVGDDQQIAMEVHRGLGFAGGARGEPQQRDVVASGRHGLVTDRLVERDPVELGIMVGRTVETDHFPQVFAVFGARDELVHQPGVAERDPDLGFVDDLGQLTGAQHRHRVDHHRAGLRGRQPARHHRRVVGAADQHPIAGLDAVVLGEGVGEPIRPVGELLVGASTAVADQRRVVAHPLVDDPVGELDRGVEVLGILEPVEQQVGPLGERREIVAGERVDVATRTEDVGVAAHDGTTAVASISTLARGSTSRTTCTSAIAG